MEENTYKPDPFQVLERRHVNYNFFRTIGELRGAGTKESPVFKAHMNEPMNPQTSLCITKILTKITSTVS